VSLNAQLLADDLVIVADYFGWPPNQIFRDWVRERPDVLWVEDRAQVLWTGDPPWAPWCVFSARKLLGVPNGGILLGVTFPASSAIANRSADLTVALPELMRFEDREEGSSLFRVGSSLFLPATFSVRPRVSNRLHTQRGEPIQRGGRLSLVRRTFVNAGLRPPPSAAVGVDKGSPHQLCSPPSVRRKRMAEPSSPTAEPTLPTPNGEEARGNSQRPLVRSL
jgi:hypothetical protein